MIKKYIKKKYAEKCVNKERNQETKLTMVLARKKRITLTSEEKYRVQKMWGGVANPDISEWEVYKYFYGFDERFLGHNIYLPLISRRLNKYNYTKFFENKCLTDIFRSTAFFPDIVLKCIDGEFYDNEMHQLGKNEVNKYINSIDFSIFIKPSIDTGNGRGVMKANPQREKIDVTDFKKYGNNFVIQKYIEQSETTARFNQSSVNTFRVTSLYLNGIYSICNIIFRYGNNDSVVDNANQGGNVIGIYEDGHLYDYGLDNRLNKIYEHNDIKFKEESFFFISDLLKKVKELHMNSFSLCKLIGWDIAIDKNNRYVILEVNTSQPGVFFEQLAVGQPIFKERTKEVIDYVIHKEFQYGKSLFRY